MGETLRWWLILQLVGIALLPLCMALLRRLPDRGYALSKPFGLLFLGYTFWLLNSLHVLPNSNAGVVASLLLLALIGAAFAWRERDDLQDWLSRHWGYVLGIEALFLLVFAVGVWLRSQVGNISGTEQPMDFMFLNAVTRADHFPPEDPWLSGFSVAYYYFGYLIIAMTGRLAGVPTDVAYNIGLAMIAALALVGAAGLVYGLVRMRESAEPEPEAERARRGFAWKAPAFGLAGGLLLVVMGNFVWLFTFLSAYGIGGHGFYDWLDVSGLSADEIRRAWYPAEYFGFFNASRIYPLNHQDFRAITEFPMFSFVLGDLHPHVMALPFVLLALGAALSLYRSDEPLDITFWLKRPLALVGVAILLGGLAFLNTWDIVTLGFFIVAAVFVSNYLRVRRMTGDLFVQVATFVIPLVVLAFVAYIPFYTSFSSQADGIGAVVTNNGITVAGTRPVHLLLFWGPLFAIVLPFVVARLLAHRDRIDARLTGLALLPGVLVVVAWAALFLYEKATDSAKLGAGAGGLFTQVSDRGAAWITAIFLVATLSAALLALWLEMTAREDRRERQPVLFALLLAAVAMLLVLGTEFFYVGDVFNSRMNTVFKLYYQSWLLLAIAGGFALYYLAARWRISFPSAPRYRRAWGGVAAVSLAAAALYPLGATFDRLAPANADGTAIEVNGSLHGIRYYPADERDAIDRLSGLADGQDFVIAEAVGNDYTDAGRISGATGLPAVLGWAGHEDQWRGDGGRARAGRFEDVNTLYTTTDPNVMRDIVEKYGVTHIVVGGLERQTYGVEGLKKFESLTPVFQSSSVTIYRVGGGQGAAGEVEAAR